MDSSADIPRTRIYLEEMQEYLPYDTKKSCRRWCVKMGVVLYRDIGTLRKYALRSEFANAYAKYKIAEIHNTRPPFLPVNMDKKRSRVIMDGTMDKPLYIPEGLKAKGLTVYCNRCKRNVSEICRDTGKPIQECKFGSKHVFKVYTHIGDGSRKTKNLDTRDAAEASRQAREIAQKIKGGINNMVAPQNKIKVSKERANIESLEKTIQRYIGVLRNENVPWHRVEGRSIEHIKDIERAMNTLEVVLKDAGTDASTISIYDVDDEMVGTICRYLVEEKKFSSRSLNKYLTFYTSLFKWYNTRHDSNLRNIFKSVPRDEIVPPEPVAISKEEYEALLNIITPERGIRKYEANKKKVRNFFRPWLVPSIKLGLETGLRREQLISLRYNDIFQHTDGNFYIQSENLKSNRIRKSHGDQKKRYVYIRITESLNKLLFELGYEKYKHTDNYLLASDVQLKRNRILSDTLTKGFSHYYAQLNTGQSLTFKSLRKRHMTALKNTLGDNAKYVSGHASDSVLDKNYIDKKEISKGMDDFKIFPNESNRTRQINRLRNNKKAELTLNK